MLRPSSAGQRRRRHSLLHLNEFFLMLSSQVGGLSRRFSSKPQESNTLLKEREARAAGRVPQLGQGPLYGENAKATSCPGSRQPYWAQG